jgi:hypothetical protein
VLPTSVGDPLSILGTRVLRTEDPRFLTTGGAYTEDLTDERLAGAVHVFFARSPVAHVSPTGGPALPSLPSSGGGTSRPVPDPYWRPGGVGRKHSQRGKRLTFAPILILGGLTAGLGLQVIGNVAVARSIWRRPLGDAEVSDLARSLQGFELGHDVAGLGGSRSPTMSIDLGPFGRTNCAVELE